MRAAVPPADLRSDERTALVRRGLWLNWITIGYNVVEALVAVVAGIVAGSPALVSFGFDSVIEVTASVSARWRLRADWDEEHRERVELITVRVVGWCFLALAAYVAYDSVRALVLHEPPERSVPGLVILALSVVVMPLLARAKRRIARALGSRALEREAAQTSVCAYLSIIGLAGVALNGALGRWWADPVAALGMLPIIVMEGVEGIRGEACCDDCETPRRADASCPGPG